MNDVWKSLPVIASLLCTVAVLVAMYMDHWDRAAVFAVMALSGQLQMIADRLADR